MMNRREHLQIAPVTPQDITFHKVYLIQEFPLPIATLEHRYEPMVMLSCLTGSDGKPNFTFIDLQEWLNNKPPVKENTVELSEIGITTFVLGQVQ